VGKATNLRARLGAHTSQGRWFDAVKYLPCEQSRLAVLEKEMRALFGPRVEGNTDLTRSNGRGPARAAAQNKQLTQLSFWCIDEQLEF
jgi:hypothetical protein